MKDCCNEDHPKSGRTVKEGNTATPLNYVLIGVVAILLLFSVVQTFQIKNLRERVGITSLTNLEGNTLLGGRASLAPSASPSPPAMVGGC